MSSEDMLEKGKAAYSAGEYEEALLLSRRLECTNVEAMGLEGRSLLRLKRYSEAVEVLKRATDTSPSSDMWLNLVSALSGAKKFEEAYATLEKATEMVAPGPEIMLTRGKILRDWDRRHIAMGVCMELIARYPLYKPGWEFCLSLSQHNGDEYMKRRAAYALLELDENHSRGLKAAIESEIARGSFEEAKQMAKKSVSLHPRRPVGWLLLSEAEWELSNPERSLAFVERALFLNTKYARGWLHKAIVLSETGRKEEAEEAYKKGFQLNPGLAKKKCIQNSCLSFTDQA